MFVKWYRHLGYKDRTVYNLIDRYNLLQKLQKPEDVERLEDLPVTLTYEIARPNSEDTPAKAQAKAEVLDGSIATLKAYRERIAELEAQAKQATEKAEQAEAARQIAEQDPIKKAHIAQFLKEWWGVKRGGDRAKEQNAPLKTLDDIGEFIGEDKYTTKRILKLNELIPQLQRLVSSGKLGTTSAEQLAYLTPEVQTALYDALGEEIGERTVAQT